MLIFHAMLIYKKDSRFVFSGGRHRGRVIQCVDVVVKYRMQIMHSFYVHVGFNDGSLTLQGLICKKDSLFLFK